MQDDLDSALLHAMKLAETPHDPTCRCESCGEEPKLGPEGADLKAKVEEVIEKTTKKAEVDIKRPVEIMQKLVTAKHRLVAAYHNYADRLRHHGRDGISKHFNEHACEERQNAYELTLRLVAMGEDAAVGKIEVPEVDADHPKSLFKALLEMEEEGIKAYQEMYEATKDDAALNAIAQDGAKLDRAHADDLLRYLREED